MLIKQLNREDDNSVYITAYNAAGEQVSVGVMVCFDWQNQASIGNAVAKPATSNLPLFAGIVAGGAGAPNYADIATSTYGLIQVYGPHKSVAYNVGAASLSCAGQWLIPVNAQYSGQTNQISGVGLSWTSQQAIIARGAFLMTNDLSATGWAEAFIRAL